MYPQKVAAKRQPLPMLGLVFFAEAFRDLSVSVSTFSHGDWVAFHAVPGVIEVEVEHGAQPLRGLYNDRCLKQVMRNKRTLLGTHAGFHDFFVPVVVDGAVNTVVVAGPFATSRPTSAAVQERWSRLTQSQGRMTDPVFCEYLVRTLATLTLEGKRLGAFKKLLSAFGRVLGEQPMPAFSLARVRAQSAELRDTRFIRRMWEEARSMVDERSAHLWSTQLYSERVAELGLARAPRHVAIGMLSEEGTRGDAVDAALRRHAYQRACAELARRRGHTVCGQFGDYGVTLLTDDPVGEARVRASLVDLATRAGALARRFGFRLHTGLATGRPAEPLVLRYRAAIAAAGAAQMEGRALVFADREVDRSLRRLRQLRGDVGRSIQEAGTPVSQRFDRYVESVLVHAGYQREVARALLEAGLDRLSEAALALGALDQRALDDLCLTLEHSAESDASVLGLVAAYRRVVSAIERSIVQGTSQRREQSLEHALEFIRSHIAEPLTLARVASVAGFAPAHFSRLFRQELGITFELHLQHVRLERAKQILVDTRLGVGQVATLVGFQSRTTFQRLFKRVAGVPPAQFYKQPGARKSRVTAFSGERA
jgi:AraC-like DNA-binding protein